MSLVNYNQSGYCGFSMSERAVDAYRCGEMPLSHWTKSEIVDAVVDANDCWCEDDLKPFLKQTLQEICLCRSSWHHTGKFANETDFYSLDEDFIAQDKDAALVRLQEKNLIIKESNKQERQQIKEALKFEKGIVYWEYWNGSRRWGNFKKDSAYTIKIGDWAYCAGFKKKLSGNHCLGFSKITRAEKGTKHIFDELLATCVPEKYIDKKILSRAKSDYKRYCRLKEQKFEREIKERNDYRNEHGYFPDCLPIFVKQNPNHFYVRKSIRGNALLCWVDENGEDRFVHANQITRYHCTNDATHPITSQPLRTKPAQKVLTTIKKENLINIDPVEFVAEQIKKEFPANGDKLAATYMEL